MLGGEGNDTILGGLGDDRITGEAGNDLLLGEAGADILTDGGGVDTLFGGDGDDAVVASDDAAGDLFDGGLGSDTLNYGTAFRGVVIDTVQGRAEGASIGTDQFAGFENIVGGAGDDRFIAGFQDLVLRGGAGCGQL